MANLDLSGIASMDQQEFTDAIKAASSSELTDVMNGDQRAVILAEAFDRLPTRFRPDRAGSTNAIIHWNITGRPDGGTDSYEVTIADGACALSDSPQHDPKLTIVIGGADFLKLISGSTNPMMMFMTGKLKAKGDLGLAANLANLFDLPKA